MEHKNRTLLEYLLCKIGAPVGLKKGSKNKRSDTYEYKVGDYVKIRTDLTRRAYGVNSATQDMVEKKGCIFRISEVIGKYHYYLDDGMPKHRFGWTNEMFDHTYDGEPVVKDNNYQYKTGDYVKIREDLRKGHEFGIYVNESMAEMKGRVMKIKKTQSSLSYELENGFGCIWTNDMFDHSYDGSPP